MNRWGNQSIETRSLPLPVLTSSVGGAECCRDYIHWKWTRLDESCRPFLKLLNSLIGHWLIDQWDQMSQWINEEMIQWKLMANAGVEYMVRRKPRVRIPSHSIISRGFLSPILSPSNSWMVNGEWRMANGDWKDSSKSIYYLPFTIHEPRGECWKDYITLAANQRALWGVMTPAVETPCSTVFSILSSPKTVNGES